MSKTLYKVLSLVLALVMVLGLAACGGSSNKPADTTPTEAPADNGTEPAPAESETEPEPAEEEVKLTPVEKVVRESDDTTIVFATATFGQKFSPFFSTTAYDVDVVELVSDYLLAADRGGAVIHNGIEGETVDYNGTDYFYYGNGYVNVVQNDDGSVDYKLIMRDDITFSDGVPATIDDVIFGIYVMADPTYDGSSTIYALPIEGISEYRNSMATPATLIANVLAEQEGAADVLASAGITDEQVETYKTALAAGGAKFAQEIVDYCMENYADYGAKDVASSAGLWGFELEEGATAEDFFNTMVDAYAWDLASLSETETAGSDLFDLVKEELGDKADEFFTFISVGEGVPNIPGIIRTGDYSMTVHMTEYDATAIYNMSFVIAPLHYYGDTALYDYDNNSFGFKKGDLSGVKAKNTEPLGCGPYVFEGYNNGVVTLKANQTYFKGAPLTGTLLMQESVDSDYVPGITTGTFDIATPSISDATVKAIKDANSNGELVGDTLTTVLVDYRGYGYLGINADLVNIDKDPGSDASKALRKGFMTLFSVYRDTEINSYYGDRAAVIQYPISNTSWAAPKPADEGYRQAYSLDVDGNPIYDASMNEEQRYEAAKEAAIGYFKAAGFEFDEAAGKFVGVEDTYEVMIPGSGQQDHPAYGVAVAASEVLAKLGITLQVNDVGTSTWNNALESNTAMMWAAAWQASVDPDMTQVYHSTNAHGNGTNSNHYSVDDPELDALIVAGRKSADTEERKSIYKDAMEIIMDWGCELPLYQRKECTVFSTERIDIPTVPQDMTPYWGWRAEIWDLAAVQ